jgi:hypothetical protein
VHDSFKIGLNRADTKENEGRKTSKCRSTILPHRTCGSGGTELLTETLQCYQVANFVSTNIENSTEF